MNTNRRITNKLNDGTYRTLCGIQDSIDRLQTRLNQMAINRRSYCLPVFQKEKPMKLKPKSLGQVAMDSVPGGTMYSDATWSRAARAVVREWERRQWRPIKTAPKDTYVLVSLGGVVYRAYYWRGEWFRDAGTSLGFDPDAWRPLPKGPR